MVRKNALFLAAIAGMSSVLMASRCAHDPDGDGPGAAAEPLTEGDGMAPVVDEQLPPAPNPEEQLFNDPSFEPLPEAGPVSEGEPQPEVEPAADL